MIEQKYSGENHSLRQDLSQANSDIRTKTSELKKLKKKVKDLESFSNSVNEAVCPKCNISLEDSMVFTKEDLAGETEKVKVLEDQLQQKTQEVQNMYRHIEDKTNNERMFKQDVQMKTQYIMQLEKDKFNLAKQNQQLHVERSNFLMQLKELQESVVELKKNSNNDKLMIDAYCQSAVVKVSVTGTQSDQTEIKSPPQENKMKPRISAEVPSCQKKKTLTKKYSKKTFKKPPTKLQFNRKESASTLSAQSSPPKSSFCESESNFNHSVANGRDNEVLTNELIISNREMNNLRSQLRKCESSC